MAATYPVWKGGAPAVAQLDTITVAGANVRGDFNGLFPLLLPGDNIVTYTDAEGARTVMLRVTKEDRST